MNNNSDPLFNSYQNINFENVKSVEKISALSKLQAQEGKKSKITIRVDNSTLAIFKARAEMTGENYQILMNEALRQFSQSLT